MPVRRAKSQNGCLPCRARRVKCDEQQPMCSACTRLAIECTYISGPLSLEARQKLKAHRDDLTEAGLKRRRVTASCQRCRRQKAKCDGQKPCKRCESKNLSCEYVDTHQATQSYDLKDRRVLDVLLDAYFRHVHPLRSFNFVHQPTLMQKLDDEDFSPEDDPLTCVICALATTTFPLDQTTQRQHGKQWAEKCRSLMLPSPEISTYNLGNLLLLIEYDARIGNPASSFLLTGLMTRMSQALQLNVEADYDVMCLSSPLSACVKESRRRVMWSTFVTDSYIASGVEQLRLIRETDFKIQLPCKEQNFAANVPCVTETLYQGNILPFVGQKVDASITENMGLSAYLIRLVSIRGQILRLVKTLDEELQPWLGNSNFARLASELDSWLKSLPMQITYSTFNTYLRKSQHELSAFLHLHMAYHQCFCDLYRIVEPQLCFPQTYKILLSSPPDWTAKVQGGLLFHARMMVDIFKEILRHGEEATMEPSTAISAHEAAKILLCCKGEDFVESTKVCIDALKLFSKRFLTPENYLQSLAKMMTTSRLSLEGFGLSLASRQSRSPLFLPEIPAQASVAHVLHPFAMFQLTQKSVRERHQPEKSENIMAIENVLCDDNNAFEPQWGMQMINGVRMQPWQEFSGNEGAENATGGSVGAT